jgi:hypothetical protein
MNAKLILLVESSATYRELCKRHVFERRVTSAGWDSTGRVIVAVYPRHAHTRFALADEPGVVVLPGFHDPAPIGALAMHLAHVEAKPEETMRAVALRLHVAHGPDFHPDV